jgi:hypothetical protein
MVPPSYSRAEVFRMPQFKLSKYNDQYLCKLFGVRVDSDKMELQVDFAARCDSSLGPLNPPAASSLIGKHIVRDDAVRVHPSHVTYTQEVDGVRYKGTMHFSLEQFGAEQALTFEYGNAGYRGVELHAMPRFQVSRYNENYVCSINAVRLDAARDGAEIAVDFYARCDGSLGPLQPPVACTLQGSSGRKVTVSDKQAIRYKIEQDGVKYLGTMCVACAFVCGLWFVVCCDCLYSNHAHPPASACGGDIVVGVGCW